jgi:hypothetical protein
MTPDEIRPLGPTPSDLADDTAFRKWLVPALRTIDAKIDVQHDAIVSIKATCAEKHKNLDERLNKDENEYREGRDKNAQAIGEIKFRERVFDGIAKFVGGQKATIATVILGLLGLGTWNSCERSQTASKNVVTAAEVKQELEKHNGAVQTLSALQDKLLKELLAKQPKPDLLPMMEPSLPSKQEPMVTVTPDSDTKKE